jgi:hypothetical protein
VVFGGMLASTLLAIHFVPVFYVVMQSVSERQKRGEADAVSGPQVSNSKSGEIEENQGEL